MNVNSYLGNKEYILFKNMFELKIQTCLFTQTKLKLYSNVIVNIDIFTKKIAQKNVVQKFSIQLSISAVCMECYQTVLFKSQIIITVTPTRD